MVVWVVSRKFSAEIRHISSLNAPPAVLCVVFRRGRLHLQLSDFEDMSALNDVYGIIYARTGRLSPEPKHSLRTEVNRLSQFYW